MKMFIITVLSFLLSYAAHAEITHLDKSSVDLICCSHHFRDAGTQTNNEMVTKNGWNENNFGFEYKYSFTPNSRVNVGMYRNSMYNTSIFFGMGQVFDITQNIDFVLEGGIVTGYDKNKYQPVIIPGLTFGDSVHVRISPLVIGISVTIFRW